MRLDQNTTPWKISEEAERELKTQLTDKDVFEVATPTYAVISTSSAEEPEEKLTDALEEYGIETYDTMGKNVITYSDGKTIWFE